MSISEQLYNACEKSDVKIIPTLIVKGGDPNWKNPDGGLTALQSSCLRGDLDVVSALTSRGGFPDLVGPNGYVALHFAAKGGHQPVVEYLLLREANCLAVDDEGKSPSDVARDAGFIELAKYISEAQQSFEEKLKKQQAMYAKEEKELEMRKKRMSKVIEENRKTQIFEDVENFQEHQKQILDRLNEVEDPQTNSTPSPSSSTTDTTKPTTIETLIEEPTNEEIPNEETKPIENIINDNISISDTPSTTTTTQTTPTTPTSTGDVYIDQKKKSKKSFFARALVITSLMSSDSKKSKEKQKKDKGDKWIGLLND